MAGGRPPIGGAEQSVGIIGCGLIATPVIRALQRGELPGWKLGAVLARSQRQLADVDVLDDADRFFSQPFDLIVEAAGPGAVTAHGVRALGLADVWSVSGTALADPQLLTELEQIGAESNHRFRLVAGAISGLDGVAALSVAHDATVHATVDLVPKGNETTVVFEGTVSEAAAHYPHHVNVTVATALAGLGMDRTSVTIRQPKADAPHTLTVEARSRDGAVQATALPVVSPPDGIHIVASSLIAALRRENQVIWVG